MVKALAEVLMYTQEIPRGLVLQLHFMWVFFDEPSPLGPDAIGARMTMPG